MSSVSQAQVKFYNYLAKQSKQNCYLNFKKCYWWTWCERRQSQNVRCNVPQFKSRIPAFWNPTRFRLIHTKSTSNHWWCVSLIWKENQRHFRTLILRYHEKSWFSWRRYSNIFPFISKALLLIGRCLEGD